MLTVIACLLSIFVLNCSADRRRYDGDKVLTFLVDNAETWERIQTILRHHIPLQEIDVWKYPTTGRRLAYVRIPKNYLLKVQQTLSEQKISFSVAIEDVQSLISQSEVTQRTGNIETHADIVGIFPTYSQLLQWMQDLSTQYPEIASTYSIGNTYEGRPMQVLQLSLPSGSTKWKIWLDAGMHAREWIGPTTAVYVVEQLINGWANNDLEIRGFLEKFEFHILPSANPDGYEYTFSTDRMWRKNRKPFNSTCIGVDLNRNFGFEWGAVDADSNPCSNVFMGPSPESEVEVQNIVQHILPLAASYIWYHSYHSWGEQFFTRWDYTAEVVPPDHEELLALAWDAVYAINAVHNELYEAGTAPLLMYAFSGSSSDWSRGAAQIKYPYLQELRDRNGDYAFVPPQSEIIPCGEENWAGFLVVLREVLSKYGNVVPPS